MKTEIRKDIREYILNDVNLTLSRLGISEKLGNEKIITDKSTGNVRRYEYDAKNIKHFPVMFKTLSVECDLEAWMPREGDALHSCCERFDFVFVRISYAYHHFDGGSNGCRIGDVIYKVDKELPNRFNGELFDMDEEISLYVRKVRGIII